jgi:hypothetical protein
MNKILIYSSNTYLPTSSLPLAYLQLAIKYIKGTLPRMLLDDQLQTDLSIIGVLESAT